MEGIFNNIVETIKFVILIVFAIVLIIIFAIYGLISSVRSSNFVYGRSHYTHRTGVDALKHDAVMLVSKASHIVNNAIQSSI
jgi:hypothetical protein